MLVFVQICTPIRVGPGPVIVSVELGSGSVVAFEFLGSGSELQR